MNTDHILLEARISADEKVIYKDKTPKSLYEYYLNGYTDKDIWTLIENLRMDFDFWDKTVNFYKSSNDLMALSGYDISILYEDNYGNNFIYSFATKKIYYYDRDNTPYINLNLGMSIIEFLDVAKRDFEALLRTPYGKKYITEGAILTEGVKEFFGYGKAYRIFIDGRIKGNEHRYAFDEHTYACVDALVNFSKGIMTSAEYERMLNRKSCIVEIYKNSDLGERDLLRRMRAEREAMSSEEVMSFADVLQLLGQDVEDTYELYCKTKAFQTMLQTAQPMLNKYFMKNPIFGKCLVLDKGTRVVDDDVFSIDRLIKNPLLIISNWYNNCILKFDMEMFRNTYIGSMKSRIERFNNTDIHYKFMSHIDAVLNILKVSDKTRTWCAHSSFDVTEENAKLNGTGLCSIFVDIHGVGYHKSSYKTASFMKKAVSHKLFESLSGVSYDAFIEDAIRIDCKIPCKETFSREISDNELMMSLEGLENEGQFDLTTSVVIERSSMLHSIEHKVRDGIEAAKKGGYYAARIGEYTVGRAYNLIKDIIEDFDEKNEDDKRATIIEGSLFRKLRRIFIASLAVSFVGKQVTGKMSWGTTWAAVKYIPKLPFSFMIIAYLVKLYNGTEDDKARQKIIAELEGELKITREKIEDAKSDNNRKAKYELMRIEQKLENELVRIKYGQKD